MFSLFLSPCPIPLILCLLFSFFLFFLFYLIHSLSNKFCLPRFFSLPSPLPVPYTFHAVILCYYLSNYTSSSCFLIPVSLFFLFFPCFPSLSPCLLSPSILLVFLLFLSYLFLAPFQSSRHYMPIVWVSKKIGVYPLRERPGNFSVPTF